MLSFRRWMPSLHRSARASGCPTVLRPARRRDQQPAIRQVSLHQATLHLASLHLASTRRTSATPSCGPGTHRGWLGRAPDRPAMAEPGSSRPPGGRGERSPRGWPRRRPGPRESGSWRRRRRRRDGATWPAADTPASPGRGTRRGGGRGCGRDRWPRSSCRWPPASGRCRVDRAGSPGSPG